MTMSLVSRVVARNYKNVRIADGIDFGALSILIGANGSGKSNLTSLFQFLQECLFSASVEDQHGRTSFEDAVYKLGGTRILDGSLDTPANVEFEYQFAIDGNETTLGIKLLIQDFHRQVILEREYLDRGRGLSNPPAYYRVHSSGNGGSGSGVVSVLDYPNYRIGESLSSSFHLETIKDISFRELALSAMPRLLENSRFPPEAVLLYEPRGKIMDFLKDWRFYNSNNMDLERIRLSEPKLGQSDIFVSPAGDNLALVLYNLVQVDFEFEELLNQLMKDILPSTRKVRAVAAGRFSLAVEWNVEGSNEPFFLYEMSDGTVRMLCWAVILHSPKLPSLIVIDEPELGIHPAWMPILAEWIKVAAQRTQVIISTHSPDLLDHFTDQLGNACSIYAFQPDTESPSHHSPTRLTRDAVSGWLEEGWQLGDLYRVGNPAVGGWPW